MEERLFNTLSMVNEEMAGVTIATKKAVAKEIAELIQSEYVEKDFVLWLQLNCNSSGHYWILKTDYPRDMFSWKSINDMHDHWLKEVKGVKQ